MVKLNKKIPIFTTGKFRDMNFDKETMKKIVDNFKELYPRIQPVLKLTHSNEQLYLQILAKKYGFDINKIKGIAGEKVVGVGSVKDLEFDEEKGVLYAEITDIPQDFAEFVNNTPTRRISPEFYQTNDGFVLRAVALVDIPENKNIDKIIFNENDKMNMSIIQFNELEEELKMEKEILKLKEKIMELEKNLENAKKENEKLNKEIAEFNEKIEAKDKLIVEFEEKVKSLKIEKKVDELIANGSLTADKKDLAMNALKTVEFDEDFENNPIFKLLSEIKVVDTKVYSEKEKKVVKAEKEKKNKDEEEKVLLQKFEELVENGVDPEEATKIVYGKLLD